MLDRVDGRDGGGSGRDGGGSGRDGGGSGRDGGRRFSHLFSFL